MAFCQHHLALYVLLARLSACIEKNEAPMMASFVRITNLLIEVALPPGYRSSRVRVECRRRRGGRWWRRHSDGTSRRRMRQRQVDEGARCCQTKCTVLAAVAWAG